MFFFLLFIKEQQKYHKCIHDSLNYTIKIDENANSIKKSKNSLTSISREKIRIVFNISQIINKTDSKMCLEEGEVIQWSQGTYLCQENNLITSEKEEVIKESFTKLTNFLEDLLKLYTLENPILVSSMDDIRIDPFLSESDLFIAVVARPYSSNSDVLATSAPYSISSDENRPITGAIYINSGLIPSTFNENFYFTLLHETCHVLGLTNNLYKKWRHPETGEIYYPFETYKLDSAPGKIFIVENGPFAHRFAVEKYGLEYMTEGVESGILIEDFGGSGTAYSHPKNSVYFTELMTGVQVPPVVLSNITLSLLSDTGYYDINFSLAEPFAFGDGASLGIDRIQNFTIDPPQLVFPQHYLCEEPQADQCSWNYRSAGFCSPALSVDCESSSLSTDQRIFCNGKSFYDPNNTNYMGIYPTLDYQLLTMPYTNFICTDTTQNTDENKKFGNLFGENSMCTFSTLYNGFGVATNRPQCYKMTCSESGELSVYVDSQRKTCSKEGEQLMFIGYIGSLTCPDPVKICSLQKFIGIPSQEPDKSSWNLLDYPWLCFIIAFVVVIVILAIVLISLKCYRKRQANRYNKALQEILNDQQVSPYT